MGRACVLLFCIATAIAQTYFPPAGETLEQQSRKTPPEVGLKSGFVEALRGKAARWALWRDGYLVHVEGDFNHKRDVASLRKTWHAMIVGAAIGRKMIPSYEQKISVHVPTLKGNHAQATWRDVIRQTSGFDYPYGDFPAFNPGEMWTYSDKNPRVLCTALARVFGKKDYTDGYEDVAKRAFFDAIGMRGWSIGWSREEDGPRFILDLEDMGRLGLLVLSRGRWNGQQLVPAWFVEELETKQTRGMKANYNGPDDGKIGLTDKDFPEAPYGYMTWVNTDGDYYPGADRAWAWGSGAGGSYVLWNRNNGIVFAAQGKDEGPAPVRRGIPHILEQHVSGPNPLTARR